MELVALRPLAPRSAVQRDDANAFSRRNSRSAAPAGRGRVVAARQLLPEIIRAAGIAARRVTVRHSLPTDRAILSCAGPKLGHGGGSFSCAGGILPTVRVSLLKVRVPLSSVRVSLSWIGAEIARARLDFGKSCLKIGTGGSREIGRAKGRRGRSIEKLLLPFVSFAAFAGNKSPLPARKRVWR